MSYTDDDDDGRLVHEREPRSRGVSAVVEEKRDGANKKGKSEERTETFLDPRLYVSQMHL